MRRSAILLLVMTCVVLSLAFAPAPTPKPGRQESDKVQATREGVEVLSGAVETYHLNNGEYPTSLKALTQQQPSGNGPIVGEKALTDPWGHPYQYDPKGLRNKELKADVWSLGPDPKNPKGVIGNWQRDDARTPPAKGLEAAG